MIKGTCMHCNFQSSAETFEELDAIYESHSKAPGHQPEYHFYELERKVKGRIS
jgi:hypothetical protein